MQILGVHRRKEIYGRPGPAINREAFQRGIRAAGLDPDVTFQTATDGDAAGGNR